MKNTKALLSLLTMGAAMYNEEPFKITDPLNPANIMKEVELLQQREFGTKDVEAEYELIKQKKSKLPANKRAAIVAYMEKRNKEN